MAHFGRRSLQSGQSMVELALALPLLILLLSGLLDLGRLYFTYVALEDAVGEAAAYLSLNPTCQSSADGAACTDPKNATYRAIHAAGGDGTDGVVTEIDWTKATVSFDVLSAQVGDPVTVTIDYAFDLISPLLPRIPGMDPLIITVSASQTIITESH